MNNSENPGRPVKHWYLLTILGVIFVVIGIWVLLTPLESYVTLAIFFGLAFLFTGILEVSYAISNRKTMRNWGWSLVGGIVDILIGLLLTDTPQITMLILPFFVGFGILFRSVMAIGWSLALRKDDRANWQSLLVLGILGVLFAFIVLWNPVLGGMTIVFYTAIAFITVGAFQIWLSLQLKRL